MKIYSMPEAFLTDQEVPVRWRILGVINGFHINGKDFYGSNDWLARQLDCSERSITNGVKELEALEEIYCERTRRSRIIKRKMRDSKELLSERKTASISDGNELLTISDSNSLNLSSESFAPQSPQLIEEIREEEENPIGTWERHENRVIPKPYSPRTTSEAWKNGERRLQILDWFFTEKKLWQKADTEIKLKSFLKRHNNAAKRLARADWKKSEMNAAKSKALFSPEMEEEWTLETIEKYLTK